MKIFTGILLGVFLLIQIPHVEASTDEKALNQQIEALRDYLAYQQGSIDTLSAKEMRQIILNAETWQVASQEENGHFGYEYVPLEDRYLKDDNMIRQAGTLFALSEIYKHQVEKDAATAEAIEKAISYFESISVKGKSIDGDFLCIKNTARSRTCSTGSVCLALIGILNYVAAHPEKKETYKNTIEKYAAYILAARHEGAGFSGSYWVGGGFSSKESPFYNGEAMLALVRYYQYRPDEHVKKVLDETFAYLSAKEIFESPLYLWIMAALKDMNRLWPNAAYTSYASEFTSRRLGEASARHDNSRNYCAVPEGFTSAYSVLKNSESAAYLTRLNTEIEFWLAKTSYLQIREENPYRLVIKDGQPQLKKVLNPDIADGGFLTAPEEPTQRVDFTQHCVSAYVQKLIDIDGGQL